MAYLLQRQFRSAAKLQRALARTDCTNVLFDLSTLTGHRQVLPSNRGGAPTGEFEDWHGCRRIPDQTRQRFPSKSATIADSTPSLIPTDDRHQDDPLGAGQLSTAGDRRTLPTDCQVNAARPPFKREDRRPGNEPICPSGFSKAARRSDRLLRVLRLRSSRPWPTGPGQKRHSQSYAVSATNDWLYPPSGPWGRRNGGTRSLPQGTVGTLAADCEMAI